MRYQTRGLVSILIGMYAIGLSAVIQASETAQVFQVAPAPKALARILFPPKTRGLGSKDSQKQTDASAFGLMINFRFDSSDILPESEALLRAVGEMMSLDRVQNRGIVIEGHTDSIGTEEYNYALSVNRGMSIQRYLIERFSISPQRLVVKGFGEKVLHDREQPTARINRRAMFKPLKRRI